MKTLLLLSVSSTSEIPDASGYIFGFIIAILILGYLFYALFKPEKF